jgi:hypothetical protein
MSWYSCDWLEVWLAGEEIDWLRRSTLISIFTTNTSVSSYTISTPGHTSNGIQIWTFTWPRNHA